MSKKNQKIIRVTIKAIFYIIISPILITTLIIKKIIKYNQNKKLEYQKEVDKKLNELKLKNSIHTNQENDITKNIYHVKSKTITNNEKYFIDIINKHFSNNYEIRPQVPLSSIIEKEKEFDRQYQNELNRIIDIGIFNKNTSYPLLLIEINDNTHKRKDRQIRDAKVKSICEQAGIKIIAFWTDYSNTEEYIINCINTNLRDSN